MVEFRVTGLVINDHHARNLWMAELNEVLSEPHFLAHVWDHASNSVRVTAAVHADAINVAFEESFVAVSRNWSKDLLMQIRGSTALDCGHEVQILCHLSLDVSWNIAVIVW